MNRFQVWVVKLGKLDFVECVIVFRFTNDFERFFLSSSFLTRSWAEQRRNQALLDADNDKKMMLLEEKFAKLDAAKVV